VGARIEPIDEAEAERLADRSLIAAAIWVILVVSLKVVPWGSFSRLGPLLVLAIGIAAPVVAIRSAARARRSGHARRKAILGAVLGWVELLVTVGTVLYIGVLIWLFAHSDFTF
jgi:hypothetical protein